MWMKRAIEILQIIGLAIPRIVKNLILSEKSNFERNMKLVFSKSKFIHQRAQIEIRSLDQKRLL